MPFTFLTYPQLESTNTKAWDLIDDGKISIITVVRTDHQTRGKGAGENLWESEPGKNLTFSIIISPDFIPPSRQFVITQMISLALFEVLEKRLGKDKLFIKWPNDLWYKGKKLAGILIQNRVRGNRIDYSVVGVGLNVNQKKFESDAPNPASMIHFTGQEEPLVPLLNEIMVRFEYYCHCAQEDLSSLHDAYIEKMFRLQQPSRYADKNGSFTAAIIGINRYGQVMMRDESGRLRVYGFKEVVFL